MERNINCIIVDDEPVAREILENFAGKIDALTVVGSCKSAMEAFHVINSENVDLIFLDINMPEITGLSFAKAINKDIKIIFTTAYRDYAVDGFDLQAVDYLLKPISFERLLQAVNKFLNENQRKEFHLPEELVAEKSDSFFVRADRKMVRICHMDILFVESIADYIKIHLRDKTVVTRETISNIEARLPREDFIRVHRSYIVAIDSIESFTNELIEIGSKQIPISRSYKNAVLSRLCED